MVRPGAQEQRSAKRVVCPRARADPPPQLLIPPPGPVSVFRGFCLFYSRLLQRCTRLPCRVLGNMWLGTSGLCLRFLSQRRSRCPPSGSAPGVHPRGEPRRWGPGRAQPPPPARGGEGRGRRSPETWPERGGNGPQLLAGGRGVWERRSLPLGADVDPAAVWLRFFRPSPGFERPKERASLGAGEGAAASARTPPHVFSFQSGRLRGERPVRPVTSGAPGARRGAARGGGQGQGRRADVGGGGRMEERRSGVTQPQRGPAPPRHHGPG